MKKNEDKKLGQNSSRSQFSDAGQLGCVFQDMMPPKSILRKSTDMPKPIQRVKFKKAIARHTKIRDQNPSLGCICPGEPHERSPTAPKFEDRSQEETEWQEQGARETTSIVHVKELDIFLTMKVLDNTPAVLSLGKLCDENGCSNEWIVKNHISF